MHAREKEKERERERRKRKDEGEGGRPGQREQSRNKENAHASKRRTVLVRSLSCKQTDTHTTKENPSRPQEQKGGRRRRKTRADEKGGTRNPLHPKTLRQFLPDRAKTVCLAHKNNSTK